MFRFENLEIWKLSVEYGKDCYKISDNFPNHEKFSLSDQLKRASISISNNIAEGSVGSSSNFKKYLLIAVASTLETVNILNFAHEVGYINGDQKENMYNRAEEIVRKIQSFINSLTNNNKQ